MAGRGRDMVKPAWLVKAEAEGKGPGQGLAGLTGSGKEDSANGARMAEGDRLERKEAKREKKERKSKKKKKKHKKDKKTKKDKKHKRHKHASDRSSRKRRRDPEYPLPEVRSKRRKPSMWDVRPEALPASLRPVEASQTASAGVSPSAGAAARATRHARRLFVGGLENTSEEEVRAFFDDVLAKALKDQPDVNGRVVSVFVNNERRFGFVEVSSIELATACMALDGLDFRGTALRVVRPKDYQPHLVPQSDRPRIVLDLSQFKQYPKSGAVGGGGRGGGGGHGGPGIGPRGVSTNVPDSPFKIFVGGLPHRLADVEVLELLEAFGNLRGLHVIRDPVDRVSKGFCFCEYEDPSHTDQAVRDLNGLQIGTHTLSARRANPELIGTAAPPGPASAASAIPVGGPPTGGGPGAAPETLGRAPTPVLVLFNMVSEQELADDGEYEDILLDVKEECEQFGTVKMVRVPRPGPPGTPRTAGLGKVFVQFGSASEALAARFKLEGRTFAGRVVECAFWDVSRFERNDLA